jgi:hypothetical protein
MEKQHIWKLIPELVALSLVFTLFVNLECLQAQIVHKKEAFPQLSSDQYQRIAALHPDPNRPVMVSLKLQIAKGDVRKVELVGSCGVPDVDQFVSEVGLEYLPLRPVVTPVKDRSRSG